MICIVNTDAVLGQEEWAELAERIRQEIRDHSRSLSSAYRDGFLEGVAATADRAEERLRALGLAERSLRGESSFRKVTGDE